MNTLWMRFKRLDRYNRASFIIVPIALILLLYLLISNPGSFLFSEWFQNLLLLPGLLGAFIASTSYIARFFDAFKKPAGLSLGGAGLTERAGTVLGVVLGLTAGIGLSILHRVVPFSGVLQGFAYVLFTLNCISSFGGLGNRLGLFLDKNNNPRPRSEKRLLGISALVGLGLGIALFATASAAMVSVIGVTTFFSGGVALPLWIAGAIFVGSFSSSLASSADYVAKAITFIRGYMSTDPAVQRMRAERKHEYRGAATGVSLGLVVGIVIVVAVAVAQPQIVAGLVGVVAATLILLAAISVLGGVCSRVGRLIDGWKRKPIPPLTPPAIVEETSLSRRSTATTVLSALTAVERVAHAGRARSDSEVSASTDERSEGLPERRTVQTQTLASSGRHFAWRNHHTVRRRAYSETGRQSPSTTLLLSPRAA